MSGFVLKSSFEPAGDQPKAIAAMTERIQSGAPHTVLLGVTGSGKTFTMAHVIARLNRPTLVIAPNKTLAAQLYGEFRRLFPENAVEYFVSYYDYYQPEAYIPASDTYIAKDSSINDMIDKLRHSATRSVLSRRDVLVVASVSCIYGLGAPEDYLALRVEIEAGRDYPRERLLGDLVAMHYERTDVDFHRGTFRVRGDRVEIFPAYEEDRALRVDFFGDTVESLAEIDALRNTVLRRLSRAAVFPASHYVTRRITRENALARIRRELAARVEAFRAEGRLLEARRIEERTRFDMEMIQELGYCNGIENYSRHLTGRAPGEPPPTLLDYFPEDFLLFIDESHIAVPQLQGMYRGDRSRKETLVEYGFRLPSALDNRPLRFEECEARFRQVIYVSATPGEYELAKAAGNVIELIVRPTGLVDPPMEVRPATHQVDDLLDEIRKRRERGERVLVTTLTKRMAEDLADYYTELGIRVRYLHSDITTLERMEIIRDLRLGRFDVLIGINLLREGLDLPEVSLVAVLDADKEGFLRSARSLIQTAGRAARNVNGRVVLYADSLTPSMRQAIEESDRRRRIQRDFNAAHGITPESIRKAVPEIFDFEAPPTPAPAQAETPEAVEFSSIEAAEREIRKLERRMQRAARDLEFELAAELRDRIRSLKQRIVLET
ncbi:MAG: excinuclease ABC subunit UvrB [Desulfobacterales bacterium]